jgi:two-component system OmpR family response regulator
MPSIRVLYIDDEPDIREIAVMSLELDSTFEVRSCPDGESALALIPAWRPDVVLLDVMMPSMDGPATLGHIRALPNGTDIPVVFITARAQPEDVDGMLALGAAGVIPKPFNPMELADKVRSFAQPKGPVHEHA